MIATVLSCLVSYLSFRKAVLLAGEGISAFYVQFCSKTCYIHQGYEACILLYYFCTSAVRIGLTVLVIPAGSGTRAGPQGQSLVSTGLADLDQILGGGLALGTLTLICEDVLSPHHLSLLGYFIAEGLNNDQAVLWGASHRSGAVGKLPRVAGLPSRRQVDDAPAVCPAPFTNSEDLLTGPVTFR